MIIPDTGRASAALATITYYRLRAYWLPFEANPSDPAHLFRPGTNFDTVMKLYDFDRRLRLHLLDGIELIEVAARGNWAYRMAMRYGPHGYLQPSLYPDPHKFLPNLKDLQREVGRSRDLFIKHYKSKYTSPADPPVWMAAEIMSFGLLSRWQNALGARSDKKIIAKHSGLGDTVYMSFIHHLATVRNSCAHHSRVWNRRFAVSPALPTSQGDLLSSINPSAADAIYNTLTIMVFVIGRIAPSSAWARRTIKLIRSHPLGDAAAMGFPAGWSSLPVWNSAQRSGWLGWLYKFLPFIR